MRARFHVRWAAIAQRDLRQIIETIGMENPSNAKRVFDRIRQKASDLYTLPDRGRIVPELRGQGIHAYREILVPPWRIIYRIVGSEVFVLSVIDARRNVEDILLDRFVA